MHLMKASTLLMSLAGLAATSPALAWEYVLLDADTALKAFKVTSSELGVNAAIPFSITMRTLHGGRLTRQR